MMLKRLLPRGDKGIGAVEFALLAPVFISFIIGVSQLGRLFYANADMKNALAHGARLASLHPAPEPEDDATLIAAVNARLMRDGATSRATTTVTRGTDNGNAYIQLNITYSVPLEFIFFSTPPVTLQDSRRVFTQVVNANDTTFGSTGTTTSTTSTTSSGSSSNGSTSASSTGSSTSASSASSSGDASTSSTSASTSSTSTSSTSTSSTSTSSTSSGSNASSGSNNGSSGHAHGNCPTCD